MDVVTNRLKMVDIFTDENKAYSNLRAIKQEFQRNIDE